MEGPSQSEKRELRMTGRNCSSQSPAGPPIESATGTKENETMSSRSDSRCSSPASSQRNIAWSVMEAGGESENGDCGEEVKSIHARCLSLCMGHTQRHCEIVRGHWAILLITALIFAVLAGAGIVLVQLYSDSHAKEVETRAMDMAIETGDFFSKELDRAILPLFSVAQFAAELDIFEGLPADVGPAYEQGSIPFQIYEDGSPSYKRNVTGLCNQPELIERFNQIATTVKANAKMEGILHNVQLAPEGVICLLHPLINTEDFEDGSVLDNREALGIDLLSDPFHKFIARASMKQEDVGIAGPRSLTQCPECGLYFIARLPIITSKHQIIVDGEPYNRWGFATALINWDALVERSDVHRKFTENVFDFQLTRTDRIFNEATNQYDEVVVVLTQSDFFNIKPRQVSTGLQTTNNEWIMTVQYDDNNDWQALVIFVSVLVGFSIASLLYVVLVQKQQHTAIMGDTMAQGAKVETERNITAYFAHELRNPLGAIDSALLSMPDGLPEEATELVQSMRICTTFMSSIMNNLLDVRKIEEGKLSLRSEPLSLKSFVQDVGKMVGPAVQKGVDLQIVAKTRGRDWVRGDLHRLQQILNNILSNAIKYTSSGSIKILVGWDGDSVRFECQDTGPGIPKDEQQRVFERFIQRGGAPGSGLGLAIAKHLVDLMDGTIRFDSDPTVKPGTTCIVILPLKLCEEPEESRSEDSSPLDEPLSLLIVDDIKMNRVMLKRRLEKGIAPNCTIREATTGEEALKICETEVFDVIIVDQFMEEAGGVMIGTDVIIAMRRMKVDSMVIGCSGNDLEENFLQAGADLVWQKPMPSNEEIIQQIRSKIGAR